MCCEFLVFYFCFCKFLFFIYYLFFSYVSYCCISELQNLDSISCFEIKFFQVYLWLLLLDCV